MEKVDIIVTNKKSMVDYLILLGVADNATPVVKKATVVDILGKYVAGTLPLHLACYTRRIIEVPLNIPKNKRRNKLNATSIKKYAGEPRYYEINMLPAMTLAIEGV